MPSTASRDSSQRSAQRQPELRLLRAAVLVLAPHKEGDRAGIATWLQGDRYAVLACRDACRADHERRNAGLADRDLRSTGQSLGAADGQGHLAAPRDRADRWRRAERTGEDRPFVRIRAEIRLRRDDASIVAVRSPAAVLCTPVPGEGQRACCRRRARAHVAYGGPSAV